MNSHARRHVTDNLVRDLEALLNTSGFRTSDHGVPVVIPEQMVRDIHALAYDARKARADTVEAVTT